VLRGLGGGAFGFRRDFSVGSSPTGIEAGDFNSDGRTDLAVATNRWIVVMENEALPFSATTSEHTLPPGR